MSYVTVEVEIDHGRIVPREPGQLPEKASGLLTILQPLGNSGGSSKAIRQRAELPLIRGDRKRIINPTAEELDASLLLPAANGFEMDRCFQAVVGGAGRRPRV